MKNGKYELSWAEETRNGVKVHLKVNPCSREASFDASGTSYLKVNAKNPPEKGRANKEVLEVFYELLEGIECVLRIVKGRRSRRKILFIEGEPEVVLKTLKHIK